MVLLENGGTVDPATTKIGGIIFEKGVGLRGWWDGSSIVAF